ncbi:MAG: gamma-glutamyl kinase [Pseudomonadota bacterium]
MLVCFKPRIAFLAMTKAGSTAVEAALSPHAEIHYGGHPRVKHMTARMFGRFVRPYLHAIDAPEVETVCLFREPLDWLGSWYRYRMRPEVEGKQTATHGLSFADFVSAYLDDKPPSFAQIGRPARFVRDKGGEIAVDHIYRYAHFEAFVAFLSARIGAPLEVAWLNRSPARELSALPPALQARLEDKLAEDFAIYHDHAK